MNAATARLRIKAAAYTTHLISGATDEEREVIAAWVSSGGCDEERSLRMLCLELTASHLRTGSMDLERVMKVLQRLLDFGDFAPESLPEGSPGAPSRPKSTGKRGPRAAA
jgi:hypothetical protein